MRALSIAYVKQTIFCSCVSTCTFAPYKQVKQVQQVQQVQVRQPFFLCPFFACKVDDFAAPVHEEGEPLQVKQVKQAKLRQIFFFAYKVDDFAAPVQEEGEP